MSYTARAVDVFHWRLAYSLTEMHRKLNSLLDHGNIEDVVTTESSGHAKFDGDSATSGDGQGDDGAAQGS